MNTEIHNPENVAESLIPEGWRFLKSFEVDGRFDGKCRGWVDWMNNDSWGRMGEWSGRNKNHTYIVPIEPESETTPPPTITKREEILQKAIQCVTIDRQATHGKPENSFQDIAHLWSWYKGIEFTPQEVAVMMALMKLARIKSNHQNDDNFVDLSGYCALAAELKSPPQ